MNKKFHIGICALVLALLSTATSSRAATRTVTTLSDDFSVVNSLRYWINNSNAGDTIVFQDGLRGIISLTQIPGLVINKNLTIHGPGANALRISGLNNVRVFRISAGNVTISGLRISDGFADGAGGGVLVDGGNLTINNCLINGNDAESGGGALVFGGSTLTVTNSTISGNSSAVEGGGVSNRGGTLFLTNTTINGNIAPRGGGVSVENGIGTILNSTISGNSTGDSSTSNVGGLRIISFGAQPSNVILKNTIVANNSASFALIGESANLQVTNSTENITSFGVARSDVSGPINSQGTNLIGDPTGGSGFIMTGANADLLNMNPQIAALAFNGGTIPTQALMADSPAIDAGNNTGAPATDQRGAARPVGAAVDIGAFETGVPVTSGNTSTGSNINTSLGADSVTFSNVSTAGTTTQIPIDPSSAGTLPNDYSFGAGYPAYEITTTANYTAPIIVCLQVPAVTNPATFAGLRILHNEGGVLVDRTILPPDAPAPDFATKTICARVNSLSPFVVANAAPTAASVSVGGRISDSNGNGIAKVRVSITNQNGETQTVLTNAFGYYHFDEIPVGETYIISIAHKRFQFSQNTQVLVVLEKTGGINFTAQP